MELLQKNWNEIKDRVILPLWNGKYKRMYENVKMDYDDFESLAGLELSKAIGSFNPEKSNIFTYATRVVSAKALTELRNCTQRDKRKSLHLSESLDKPLEDNQSRTIGDSIPYEDNNKEVSELSELRVGNFINSLNNNQLRVLALSLLDFNANDISGTLNISDATAQSILRSLKDVELTRVLYRRKF